MLGFKWLRWWIILVISLEFVFGYLWILQPIGFLGLIYLAWYGIYRFAGHKPHLRRFLTAILFALLLLPLGFYSSAATDAAWSLRHSSLFPVITVVTLIIISAIAVILSFCAKYNRITEKSMSLFLSLSIFVIVFSLYALTDTYLYNYSFGPYEYQPPLKTGDGWKVSTLEEERINSSIMDSVFQRVYNEELGVFKAIVIARNGRLVLESYHQLYNRNDLHFIASDVKSVISLLVGIAHDKGFITDIDEPIFDFFPEHSDLKSENKSRITIRHLLTMTSGFVWDEFTYTHKDPRDDLYQMSMSEDAVRFVLARNLEYEPGTYSEYITGNSFLLAAILKRAINTSVEDFAEIYLFEPMDIMDYEWESLRDGSSKTPIGLFMKTRDMAKIGQLVLNRGIWDGQQLVSEGWLADSTRPSEKSSRYGYQWWISNYTVDDRNIKTIEAHGYRGHALLHKSDLSQMSGWYFAKNDQPGHRLA